MRSSLVASTSFGDWGVVGYMWAWIWGEIDIRTAGSGCFAGERSSCASSSSRRRESTSPIWWTWSRKIPGPSHKIESSYLFFLTKVSLFPFLSWRSCLFVSFLCAQGVFVIYLLVNSSNNVTAARTVPSHFHLLCGISQYSIYFYVLNVSSLFHALGTAMQVVGVNRRRFFCICVLRNGTCLVAGKFTQFVFRDYYHKFPNQFYTSQSVTSS